MSTKTPRTWVRRPWAREARNVVKAVADLTEVKSQDIETTNRHHRIAHARSMAWQVLRFMGRSLPEIGALSGGFDHSSVFSGLKKLSAEDKEAAAKIAADLGANDTVAARLEIQRRERLFQGNVALWHAMCAADIAAQKLGSMT